jgi:hypothetical protein
MRFLVSWGMLSEFIEADNPQDAWAVFCDRHRRAHPDIERFPKREQRLIAEAPLPPEPVAAETESVI